MAYSKIFAQPGTDRKGTRVFFHVLTDVRMPSGADRWIGTIVPLDHLTNTTDWFLMKRNLMRSNEERDLLPRDDAGVPMRWYDTEEEGVRHLEEFLRQHSFRPV